MPGSWETTRTGRVLVGILHVDLVPMAWALGLRNLQIPGDVLPLAGMPYDMARNTAAMRCLEGGYDWLFQLDSDVVCPRDAVLRLIAHNQPIISGVYCRRSPPHAIPVMIRNGGWVNEYQKNSVIEVDMVGAGCLLIHRSVLERMPPSRPGYHWFDWRVNLKGMVDDPVSEDFSFCLNAKKLGYKVLVDTSIQCRHIGLAEAGHGTFLPCEATPHT